MAKAKEEEKGSAPETTAAAVKEFLDGNQEGGIKEFRGWAASTYPDWNYVESSATQGISVEKKRRKEAGGEQASTPARGKPGRKPGPKPAAKATPSPKPAPFGGAVVTDEPSFADLRKVKALADERGGVEELLKVVQTVEDMGSEVGGITKLRKALELLHDLMK